MQPFAIKDYWILDLFAAEVLALERNTAIIDPNWPMPKDCSNLKPGWHQVFPPQPRPLRISWLGTRRVGDFNGDIPWVRIVGERVRRLVEDNNLKGFVFRSIKYAPARYPEEQAFAKHEVEGRFWELSAKLTLAFGPSYPFYMETKCEKCGWKKEHYPRRGALSFDTNGWSGHDAFKIKDTPFLCVSARFRSLVIAAQLTLVDFRPLRWLGSDDFRNKPRMSLEKWMNKNAKHREYRVRRVKKILKKSDYGYL